MIHDIKWRVSWYIIPIGLDAKCRAGRQQFILIGMNQNWLSYLKELTRAAHCQEFQYYNANLLHMWDPRNGEEVVVFNDDVLMLTWGKT